MSPRKRAAAEPPDLGENAPDDYRPVSARLPDAVAEDAAAELLEAQTAREAQLLAEGQDAEEAHRIAFGLPEPEPEPEP